MIGVGFWIAAFLVGIIGTVAGFGTSTLFLPVALFFLDFQTALVLVAIPETLVGSLFSDVVLMCACC